ncbi:MAG: alanine racemase [Cyanobacteria bacterium]|nr:alanine racemase [Cyanobacteriota bacterium]
MVRTSRQLSIQTRRDAWVEINLAAIEANVVAFRQFLPSSVSIMAILKADAYGHGAAMITPVLEASGVSMVGVAALDEALQLRDAGITLPILVIGAVPDWAVEVAAEKDIQLTVFSQRHLEILRNTHKRWKVHIKVDTGMHRIGVPHPEAVDFIEACYREPNLQVEGIFTHFACAEDPEKTRLQVSRFEAVLKALTDKGLPLPRYIHAANSAATELSSEVDSLYSMVRVGYGLFGYHKGYGDSHGLHLKPVLSLKARIMHLHHAAAGEGVSYGHHYQVTTDTLHIATLPLGYADGIPRVLSGRLTGLLHGKVIPQIGAITMDQVMFDVSNVPEASVGDTVTLLGEDNQHPEVGGITLNNWAALSQDFPTPLIPYELMCGLRVRLPKTYTHH